MADLCKAAQQAEEELAPVRFPFTKDEQKQIMRSASKVEAWMRDGGDAPMTSIAVLREVARFVAYESAALPQPAEGQVPPSGATHYQPHQKAYYKRLSATEWMLWSDSRNDWIPSPGSSDGAQWVTLEPCHLAAQPVQVPAEVRAERERTKTLARWISSTLATLESIDPDDMEDGGANMRSLISDGDALVKAIFAAAPLPPAQPVNRRLLENLSAWAWASDRVTNQYGDVIAGVDFGELGRLTRAAIAEAEAQPVASSPEAAGMQSAISHLSMLVEEQRALLVEVEDVCGRDGHGGPLEDGESDLIDKVRLHLGMLNTPEKESQRAQSVMQPHEEPQALADLRSALEGLDAVSRSGNMSSRIQQEQQNVEHMKASLPFLQLANPSTARLLIEYVDRLKAAQPVGREPLSEEQIVNCLVEAGCVGTVKMTYESGPYDITRTSINADKFARAIERAHGITGEGV